MWRQCCACCFSTIRTNLEVSATCTAAVHSAACRLGSQILACHWIQVAYKDELQSNFGIVFNRLLALNNMPIKRFADFLVRSSGMSICLAVKSCRTQTTCFCVCGVSPTYLLVSLTHLHVTVWMMPCTRWRSPFCTVPYACVCVSAKHNTTAHRLSLQVRRGKLDEYMSLLVTNFNPAAAEGLMCRDTVSVGWDGRLFDCDFNQQLDMGLVGAGAPRTVFDLKSLDDLTGLDVRVDNHCFGCTAGSGSGCQGATS